MNSVMSFWFYNVVKVNIQVAKEVKLFQLFSRNLTVHHPDC